MESRLLPSMNQRLNEQLEFTTEIDKMTGIFRHTLLIDRSRRENDAEHSWHIGVMALLFAEYAKEKVNIERCVSMCLVHDLIEIYAGDTYAFDEEAHHDKHEREMAAAEKLYSILPTEQGQYLKSLWEEFEAEESADAKYAVCMDRIQPFIHNMLTEGHTWYRKTTRSQVEKREAIVKEFMPEVYAWIEQNIDYAIKQGWLLED
ncbi:MAG: HD domain-containing protein [Erysipelotrichaceae bacterium]|nr:HD domain-containing protein [Erysipelotrichaceae bacterium]